MGLYRAQSSIKCLHCLWSNDGETLHGVDLSFLVNVPLPEILPLELHFASAVIL